PPATTTCLSDLSRERDLDAPTAQLERGRGFLFRGGPGGTRASREVAMDARATVTAVRRRSAVVPRSVPVAALALAFALAVSPLLAGPVHCFPDRVVLYEPGAVSWPPLFSSWQPGIVLGPPGNATPTTGSLTVLSLGRGGRITLEFTDNAIVDGPGPDFIVFENPFFCTAAPATPDAPWSSF